MIIDNRLALWIPRQRIPAAPRRYARNGISSIYFAKKTRLIYNLILHKTHFALLKFMNVKRIVCAN